MPRAARYSVRDEWWQVGDIVDGKPFGAWRTWRGDGSPLFEARFDSEGRLQGRFRRWHPDGSLAREGHYERGEPSGELVYHRARGASGDLFPSSDPRAWRIAIRHDEPGREGARVAFDEHGRELADPEDRAGDDAPAGPPGALDDAFATAGPDGFLAGDVLPRVLATLGTAAAPPPDTWLLPADLPPRRALTAHRFQDLYGVPPPPTLRTWLAGFAASPKLFHLRIAGDTDLDLAGNLIEALIGEHQQRSGRAVGLRALASGVLPVAIDDAGVHHCVALTEAEHAGTDAVYPLDGAEDTLGPPIARSLDDLAYALALASASETGGISSRCLARAFARLRGRIDLRGPVSEIEARALDDDTRADDEVVGDPEGDHREGFYFRRKVQHPRYFFFRNRWLWRLLGGHAEGAAADFDVTFEGGLDDARFETIAQHAGEPHVAFYWLFRCLVFGDPRLPVLLDRAADAPSQLARDTASLVRELAAGRARLGEIADWPALVARFRALDPMKHQPEGEAAEDPADAEPEAEAPGHALAALPDELAPAREVIEWALADGYARDNLLIKDELEAAALGLARRADPRIVPALADLHAARPWHASRLLSPWLDEDRAELAELAEQARGWLADREGGALFRWESGARVLARVGRESDARLLAGVVDVMLDASFGREQGFEAALSSLEVRRTLPVVMDALISLGVPEDLVASLEGVAGAETHLVDDARGPCALALASLGRGLDAIVAGLANQIAQNYGHNLKLGQLLALGTLGATEPAARRAELATMIEAIGRLTVEAKVGQACALRDLGRDVDLAGIVRDALDDRRYSARDTSQQRVALLGIVARRDDVPAGLALPFVQTDDLAVHRAAVRALRMRGHAAPGLVIYDPYHVNELAARGRDALHAALSTDAGVYRGNLALWLGDHPDPTSAAPLIANARRIAARGGFPSEGPAHYELRWTIRALLAIGAGTELFDELLRHDDRAIAEPVLRYADRLGPDVARGMAHVYVKDEHWRRTTARRWLVRHAADPRVAAALADHGLTIEALTGKEDEP